VFNIFKIGDKVTLKVDKGAALIYEIDIVHPKDIWPYYIIAVNGLSNRWVKENDIELVPSQQAAAQPKFKVGDYVKLMAPDRISIPDSEGDYFYVQEIIGSGLRLENNDKHKYLAGWSAQMYQVEHAIHPTDGKIITPFKRRDAFSTACTCGSASVGGGGHSSWCDFVDPKFQGGCV